MKRLLNLLLLGVALLGSAGLWALFIVWLEDAGIFSFNRPEAIVGLLAIATMYICKPLIGKLLKLKETGDEL